MSAHATRTLQAVHDDLSRRVTIQATVGNLADSLIHGDDLRAHRDEHERTVLLAGCLGDIATDISDNNCRNLESALLRLAAEVQLWLETIAREAAA